jgi:hypothetical protein
MLARDWGRLLAPQPKHPNEVVSRADEGAQGRRSCDRGVRPLNAPRTAAGAVQRSSKGSKMAASRRRGGTGRISARVL